MTDATTQLSEEAFAAQFPLRTNHINPAAGWDHGQGAGCLFETFGEELAFVRRQDPRTVWTLIDDEHGDQYVISGFRLVNRIGYLLSTVPVPKGTTFQVRTAMHAEADPGEDARTPEPWNIDAGRQIDLTPNAGTAYRIKTIEIQSYVDRGTWKTLAFIPADESESEANARRICAAVNACKGISTRALKQGAIAEMLNALTEVMYDASRFDDEAGMQPIRMKTLDKVRRARAKAKGEAS